MTGESVARTVELEAPRLALVPRPDKLLDVECLRALAITYTLFAHFRFAFQEVPAWLVSIDSKLQFWGGVDLFFVISGFVISKNLIPGLASLGEQKLESARFVLSFWVRRMYRLLPSAWLWAVLALGVIAFTNPDQLTKNVYDVVAALLQVYNFHAYNCAVGAATCSHMAVGVYWSLSLEEQFYIFLPLVFVTFRHRARWAIAGLLLLSIPVHLWWSGLLGFFRWEGFCLGVFLAWLYSNHSLHALVGEQFVARLGRLATLGGWLMVLALPFIGSGNITSLSYPLMAVASAVLVGLASFEKNVLRLPGPVRALGVWVGARSYSIYLIHIPVFVVFQWASRRVSFLDGRYAQYGWIIAATLVIVALSELNFRLVESRFRKLGRSAPATAPA